MINAIKKAMSIGRITGKQKWKKKLISLVTTSKLLLVFPQIKGVKLLSSNNSTPPPPFPVDDNTGIFEIITALE